MMVKLTMTLLAIIVGYFVGQAKGYDEGYTDGIKAEREEMARRNMEAMMRAARKKTKYRTHSEEGGKE